MDEMLNSEFMNFLRQEEITGRLPCDECGGECCSQDVIFTKDDIKRLSAKYSFKHITKQHNPGKGDTFRLSPKGQAIDISKKCVFYKDNKCSVYADRPIICKDYGSKKYSQCGYAGLTEIPEDTTNVVLMAHKRSYEYTIEMFAKFMGEQQLKDN